MHLHQRPPIDYNAAVGCERAPFLIDLAVEQLLDKAQTWRPYAAAIIRHAVSNPELGDIQSASTLPQWDLLREVSFLPHVNNAMHQNWQPSPLNTTHTTSDMYYSRTVSWQSTNEHLDQDYQHGSPLSGPLVGLFVIEGTFKYQFAARWRDVFDKRNFSYFNEQKNKDVPKSRQFASLTARAGDLVLLTPETWHGGDTVNKNGEIDTDAKSKRAVFITRLVEREEES